MQDVDGRLLRKCSSLQLAIKRNRRLQKTLFLALKYFLETKSSILCHRISPPSIEFPDNREGPPRHFLAGACRNGISFSVLLPDVCVIRQGILQVGYSGKT